LRLGGAIDSFATMAETQYLSVIRIWAALAWADGVISEAEATAMKRLIAAAPLSDDEKQQAAAFITTRVELDTANLRGLSPDARKGIYGAACRLAAVDHDVAAAERVFLGRLRDGLAISETDAKEIERGIPGI
jgi:uncharacterized membrane protein YebE (DUF533 family)